MRPIRLLTIGIVFAIAGCPQQTVDPYSTGMTLVNAAGCPIFVDDVLNGSPAQGAGIHPGDQILAVQGSPVKTLDQTGGLLLADRPDSVTLTLARNGKDFRVVVDRKKRSEIFAKAGKTIVDGLIVSPNTTQAEIDHMLSFQGDRIVDRVFPTHYPLDSQLFYGGFEIFLLRDPIQLTVGGIENGPAAKAGVHWGDALISVNGRSTSGKTVIQLEALFSSKEPASMHLQVERLGSPKSFDFRLERAEEIARANGNRLVNGQIVPAWVGKEYLHCFLKSPKDSNPQ